MTRPVPLLIASATIASSAWLCCEPAQPVVVHACNLESFDDRDGDFLPDLVEWAVLTNPNSPDTDGDLCPDFVEVVQRGSPREAGAERALDHEMRVVVTAPMPGASPADPTWLHLLFRFVGDPSSMTSFLATVQFPALGGVQVPIDMLAFSAVVIRQRQTAEDGLWVRLSVPMVSERILRNVLPCTIHATAVIGGRTVQSAVMLFDVQGVTCSLVRFSQDRMAVQSIGQLAGITSSNSNRVCLLQVKEVGSGPAGVVVEVVDAYCEDCNELECSPTCTQSIGWIFSIPGGIESITGG